VKRKLEQYADDHDSARQFGIDLATQACDELIRHGVPGIHFYVLNRSHSVTQIMRNLGLASAA
jgi:methylenetetrahydrofolate reductase (NADPH)